MIFCIFELRIRYKNIKNLGSCLIASCLSANGYAFEVGPMFFMQEIWKKVVGFEGLYEVSLFGKVRSIKRNGTNGGILKEFTNKIGYKIVVLSKNNIQKTILCHRIIAQAFIENPDNKPTVNHKNGIKNDNRIENLEWATYLENNVHAISSKLRIAPRGKMHSQSKAVIQYSLGGEIIKNWEGGLSDVFRELGFHRSNIYSHIKFNTKQSYGFIWKFK